QADLIVIPSKFEGVPLVLIEAALLNKKIIASRIDGIKDYLNATFLFGSHNIDEMSRVTLQHMTSSRDDNYRESLKTLIRRHQDDFVNDFYAALIQPSVKSTS
ncbi:glycosyltransferase, partial [Lonsdalea populi]